MSSVSDDSLLNYDVIKSIYRFLITQTTISQQHIFAPDQDAKIRLELSITVREKNTKDLAKYMKPPKQCKKLTSFVAVARVVLEGVGPAGTARYVICLENNGSGDQRGAKLDQIILE